MFKILRNRDPDDSFVMPTIEGDCPKCHNKGLNNQVIINIKKISRTSTKYSILCFVCNHTYGVMGN